MTKNGYLSLLLVLIAALIVSSCSLFTNANKVEKPTFDPPGGTYEDELAVTLRCSTLGATIFYTLDGSEPHSASQEYIDPIIINQNTTIKAKAFRSGMQDSKTVKATYIIDFRVATPIFSVPGGTYDLTQDVSISCVTLGAKIHYTTDGTEPSEDSAVYSRPIYIDTNTILKAKGFKTGWKPSRTAQAYFNILENITQPEDAKWSVMAIEASEMNLPQLEGDTHYIVVSWIGAASSFDPQAVVELSIGGSNIELLYQYESWYGKATLTPGSSYTFQLKVDGTVVVNTKQTVVYNADATFPLTFNPTRTAYVFWELEADSKQQIASAYAYDPEDWDYDEVVDKEIEPSAREYTFPANTVQHHGVDSEYELVITQFNRKYVDNVLVATVQTQSMGYGDWKSKLYTPERLAKYARRLSKLLVYSKQ